MATVTMRKTPPMRLPSAISTVPTAFVAVPLGAFCTACSSVTRLALDIMPWSMRNDCSLLNSAGVFSHSASACATSGGTTVSATRTRTETIVT